MRSFSKKSLVPMVTKLITRFFIITRLACSKWFRFSFCTGLKIIYTKVYAYMAHLKSLRVVLGTIHRRSTTHFPIYKSNWDIFNAPPSLQMYSVCWWFRNPKANHLECIKTLQIMGVSTNLNWWSPDFWTINSSTPRLRTTQGAAQCPHLAAAAGTHRMQAV